MVAYLKSLPLVNVSHIITSVASFVLEVSEDDKDGEFWEKNEFVPLRQWYATEAAHGA